MPKKMIYNPNCKKCQYRSNKPADNSCDYNYITGKMRGCPVEDCTKFAPGPRLERPRNITIDHVTPTDIMMADYAADVKRRNGVPLDTPKDYSKRREG